MDEMSFRPAAAERILLAVARDAPSELLDLVRRGREQTEDARSPVRIGQSALPILPQTVKPGGRLIVRAERMMAVPVVRDPPRHEARTVGDFRQPHKPQRGQGKFFGVQFSCEPGLKPFHLDSTAQLDIRHSERTELRTNETRLEDLIVLPRQFVIGEYYKLLGMFEELIRTVKKPKGYFRFQATLLLSGMLHLIASEFLEQNHLDHDYPASYIPFRKLVDQLNNYYDEDLNKERLEQSVGRKFEYLCQVFKKYANANIHQYVHQLRAQRAKYLLRNSSKSVKEIAEQVGYSDPFVFSRMFKKLEGVAPHYYRNDRTTDG